MSLGARVLAIVLFLYSVLAHGQDLTILTIGQSVASNYNEYQYDEAPGVFQILKNGVRAPALDPLDLLEGNRGSVWIPAGRAIIERGGLANTVTFLPIGDKDAKIKDWLPNGRAHVKLKDVLDLIVSKNFKIDYVFWFQGTADMGTPFISYESDLRKLINFIKSEIGYTPWIIARYSKCLGQYDMGVERAQTSISRRNPSRYFYGPNTNMLEKEYFMDAECYLNKAGQEKVANMWADALFQSDVTKKRAEREILLEYFKGK